jgi:UDP:flavonoid glycosyltransferase YjiC (YdhE family)
MRALFTSTPGFGHFLPLTPIARALVDAGHDVVFGAPSALRSAVEAAGFPWIKAGVEDNDPELAAVRAGLARVPADAPGSVLGSARSRFARENLFGGVLARGLARDLLTLTESWRPDVIVRESWELGGLVAGELLGLPVAKVETDAAGGQPVELADFYAPVGRLLATLGRPDRSVADLLDRYLSLVPFPAALRAGDSPMPPTAHGVRALPIDSANDGLPAWIDGIGSRPLVYVSLGTLYNGNARPTSTGLRGPEIFGKLLEGLADIDAEIVVTVGKDLDPAMLGPQAHHVHLERYLPLGALLARCSLAVFHGGSGTLGYVVSHGLPMVILPLGADQPTNAVRCAELGASRTLDQDQLTPGHIREVALDVLHTPSYRQAAGRLRDEFNALPGPEFAVELLERLARDKMPIIASR